MKNLFQMHYDKKTNRSIGEYDSFIIRKTTKEQEKKLHELSQSFKEKGKNRIPTWMYWMNRLSFSLLFVSFIFLIVNLIMEPKDNFKDFIWIIILLCLSTIVFVLSIVLAIFFKKKKKKKQDPEKTSEDLFTAILNSSKKFLSIPPSASSLEIMMETRTEKSSEKRKLFSNILLSVFVEKDMLCLADLYNVIGIPIKSIGSFELIDETYRFSFWHKKTSFKEYGVKLISVPIRCYQKDQYTILKIKHDNKDLAIYIPEYEANDFKKILEEKRD